MSAVLPVIAIDGSLSQGGGSSSINAPGSIGGDYAQLIALGADAFQRSGARIFNMDAGTLSLASPAQIGRIVQGTTVTAALVQENQLLLNAIGTYCRQNDIAINVSALLTNDPDDDWTYQWLQPAVIANLPITAVDDVREMAWEVTDTPANYAAYAQNEVAIVRQIVQYYPTVQIGEWHGGAASTAVTDWWSAYNSAADVAGLPRITYAVADTSWNAPWVTPTAVWQSWLLDLSQLVHANGMQLTVLLDGSDRSGSDRGWTAQSEQHAAMLAKLGGVTADTLLVRTWGSAHPQSVLPVTEPTTIGNAAAAIAATYPLYRDGAITAMHGVAATAAAQMILTTNTPAAVGPIALTLAASDVAADAKIAVVITAQTGKLSALRSGSGTVSGAGTNQLVLNGGSADVAAELRSLTVMEPFAGPDSIEIETFGFNGRLSDSQIALLALAAPPVGGAQQLSFEPASAMQFWATASATVTAAGIISSLDYTWQNPGVSPVTGNYNVIRTVALHEPLAEGDVTLVAGVPREPAASPVTASNSSLPFNLNNFNLYAFNPYNHLSTVNVISTRLTYGELSGKLQTITDRLAPSTPLNPAIAASLPNYFATGGWQITQLNSGDNPDWQPSWSSELASVTTTYGSDSQILEQVFQGGASEPWFVLDNVFSPYTGQLWEQFQTVPSPAPFGDFVTGTQLLTQFNTGDNPNWDYTDWGDSAQATVEWQDYYAKAVTAIPHVRTGLQTTDAYSPTSRLSLTGPSTGGGLLIGCNGTTDIVAFGNDRIYAGLGTTTIATGQGGSTIYLSNGPGSDVTVVSGGGDSIWVGHASLTITNRGTASDQVYAQGNQVSIDDGSTIRVTGDYNTVSVRSSSTVTATGNHNTVDLNGAGDILQVGSNNTVNLNGISGLGTAGTDTAAWFRGSGNRLYAGDRTTAWLVGASNALVAGDYSTVELIGNGSTAVLGAYCVVSQYGDRASAKIKWSGTLNQYGTRQVAEGGMGTTGWQAGTNNQMTAGNASTIAVAGDHNTAIVRDASTITATGGHAILKLGNACTVSLDGISGRATAGTDTTAWFHGSDNTLDAGDRTTAWLIGAGNSLTAGDHSTIDLVGDGSMALLGSWCVVWQYGTGAYVRLQSNSTVNQYGTNQIGVCGADTYSWQAGTANQLTAGSNSTVNVVGDYNTASVGDASTVTATGAHASLSLGNGGTANLNGTWGGARTGTDTTVWIRGSNNGLVAGDRTTAWVIGSDNTVVAGDESTIVIRGSGCTALLGSNDVVVEYGAGASVRLQSNGNIHQLGANQIAVGGAGTYCFQAGTANQLTAGDNSQVSIIGSYGTAIAGDASTINIWGAHALVSVGNKGMIFIHGPDETVVIRSAATLQTISGFAVANRDVLDLTQLLGGVVLNHDLSNLHDYISVVGKGADAVLTINGGLAANTVVLRGAGALGLADLLAHNALLLPSH